MKRTALAAAIAALALPASAAAATGVVLSVNSRHHTIEVVDGKHVVHAYHYRGRLPHVRLGARISYGQSADTIHHVRRNGAADGTVAFLARVVRSNSGRLVLRLADGRTVSLRLRHQRANRGVVVLVTETTDAQGNLTITITLQPVSAPGGGGPVYVDPLGHDHYVDPLGQNHYVDPFRHHHSVDPFRRHRHH